jgi:invasion protein IalB
MKKFWVMLVAILTFANLAFSEKFVSKYKDWYVYTDYQGKNKICYILSEPQSRKSISKFPLKAYVSIMRVSKNVEEVSTSAGYGYKKDGVVVKVGGHKFDMFTQKKIAWAYDKEQDKAMIQAMKKGLKMTVHGQNNKNENSTEVYSLLGFTNAYNKMKTLCK